MGLNISWDCESSNLNPIILIYLLCECKESVIAGIQMQRSEGAGSLYFSYMG